jgi:glycosyltransferase involved in cell wall biosynthesis
MWLNHEYKVSVILPTLSTDFIFETLKSIANQDFEHSKMELLIIYTGVDTDEIISKFPENFDIVTRLFKCDERGISASLNLGLNESKGEYIVRIDSDDVMLDDRISSQIEFLDLNPSYCVVGGHIQIIDRDSNVIGFKKYEIEDIQLRTRILEQSPVAHPAVTFRRDSVLKIGSYRNLPSEDTDLWVRILPFWKIANLNQYVIKYRVHINQTSNYPVNLTNVPRDLVWISHFLRLKSHKDLPDLETDWPEWIVRHKRDLKHNFYFRFALSHNWQVSPLLLSRLEKARTASEIGKFSIVLSLLSQHPKVFLNWFGFKVLRKLFIYGKFYRKIGL